MHSFVIRLHPQPSQYAIVQIILFLAAGAELIFDGIEKLIAVTAIARFKNQKLAVAVLPIQNRDFGELPVAVVHAYFGIGRQYFYRFAEAFAHRGCNNVALGVVKVS